MNYKMKYEALLAAVNEIGSDPLKEIAELTTRMVTEPEEETGMTKEEIEAIEDTTKRHQAIKENIHLYQNVRGRK